MTTTYNNALVDQMIANGDPATRDDNDALYPSVAAGDRESMDQMIQANMALVIYKVDKFIKDHPDAEHLRDDLVSEGFVGLTTAVNKMAEAGFKEKANATGYIGEYVSRHIQSASNDQGCGASPKTIQRHRDSLPRFVKLSKDYDAPVVSDPLAMLELRDVIQASCESKEDRLIVRMRERGATDQEIADKLGKPLSSVHRMRQAIYSRFLEKSGLDPK